jgi:hypothetical protein
MVAEDLFNKGRKLGSGIWKRDAGLGVLEELRWQWLPRTSSTRVESRALA